MRADRRGTRRLSAFVLQTSIMLVGEAYEHAEKTLFVACSFRRWARLWKGPRTIYWFEKNQLPTDKITSAPTLRFTVELQTKDSQDSGVGSANSWIGRSFPWKTALSRSFWALCWSKLNDKSKTLHKLLNSVSIIKWLWAARTQRERVRKMLACPKDLFSNSNMHPISTIEPSLKRYVHPLLQRLLMFSRIFFTNLNWFVNDWWLINSNFGLNLQDFF